MDGGLLFDIPDQPKPVDAELIIVDNFAGGGGASTGIERALNRSPEYAINHDAVALEMHQTNHPHTKHLQTSVWAVDPRDLLKKGQRVGLAWFSPDCKHHSKAKGGKPVEKNIRDLAWVVVSWAELVKPKVIMLENVEEFKDWCPLTKDNKPDLSRRGETFRLWVKKLRALGYKVEWRELRACDYGAPTIRKRLFVIARCDGKPIVWPDPTHGTADCEEVYRGTLLPWRSAAEIIDWSLPCPSIFDTKEAIWEKYGLRAIRPLAENTLKRVAAGVKRYVLDADEPFFVTYGQHGGRSRSAADPIHTITASPKDQNAVVAPVISNVANSKTTANRHALVSAFLAQHNTQRCGVNPGKSVIDPMATVTTRGTQINVVAAHMQSMHGTTRRDSPITDPLQTLTAGGGHAALVASFMTKYYGTSIGADMHDPMHTLTTRDRMSLITCNVQGVPHYISDIGMRMLAAREMFSAQGFRPCYKIEQSYTGRYFTKTEQTRMCGNSVPPDLAEALCRANVPHMARKKVEA
ncbi:MAG: DNA (cytosine-5-)-methyltransferase [Rhodopirellula sp.]|nr:DNA (cytosine-5-)-methyltransferase [Rhodopirellula sp.]